MNEIKSTAARTNEGNNGIVIDKDGMQRTQDLLINHKMDKAKKVFEEEMAEAKESMIENPDTAEEYLNNQLCDIKISLTAMGHSLASVTTMSNDFQYCIKSLMDIIRMQNERIAKLESQNN